MFTPTILFMPERWTRGRARGEAAVATMPGAFEAGTTLDLLTWVNENATRLRTGRISSAITPAASASATSIWGTERLQEIALNSKIGI